MRQLTFVKTGLVEWREAPDAVVEGPLEAVVRPLVLGRCDLDVAYVRGFAPMAPGEPVGHEMIGEVVDIGSSVRRFTPGMRVIVPAQISCGTCRNCRRGFTGRCQTVPFGASYGMGREGGYGTAAADLVRVPFADAMLVPVPTGADPLTIIGLADMAADSWRSVGPQLAQRPGARVLVMGGLASTIGIYAAGMAKALGAGEVVYADDSDERLAQAGRYGVRTQKLPGELDGLFEIVVDAAGTPATLNQAIRAAEPEGLVTSVVIHLGAGTPVPLQEMYWKGVTFVTGRANCRANLEPTLACCLHHGFRPELPTAHTYGFDDAPAAWMDGGVRAVAHRA